MSQTNDQSPQWLSTYGIITVERLLAYYDLSLKQVDLKMALANKETFIFQMVQLPLAKVSTGIARQQAHDLLVYAEKLYVDYFLSGESVKPESSAGGLTRESLESLRLVLVATSKSFQQHEYEHNQAIASSQKMMVTQMKLWRKHLKLSVESLGVSNRKQSISWDKNKIFDCLLSLFCRVSLDRIDTAISEVKLHLNNWLTDESIDSVIDEVMACLVVLKKEAALLIAKVQADLPQSQGMHETMINYKKQFEQMIIHCNEHIRNLPDFKLDPNLEDKNRAAIQMDLEDPTEKESQR